jgi:uncharacterized protein
MEVATEGPPTWEERTAGVTRVAGFAKISDLSFVTIVRRIRPYGRSKRRAAMPAFETITQFNRMLKNLDQWLQKGTAYAQQKGFDPDVLAQARLAPDQYSLVQQVQSACDQAKYAAAYLSGQKAPSHPDTEKTVAELLGRIGVCTKYLNSFRASDFAGGEDRQVAPPWMGGSSVRGDHYMTRIAVPNFYFHVTTAYAILRHNGVELGKRDFIGVQSWTELSD